MRRTPRRLLAALGFMGVVGISVACGGGNSGNGGTTDPPDGATNLGVETGVGIVPIDGSLEPEGSVHDSGTKLDGAQDAPVDAPIDAADAAPPPAVRFVGRRDATDPVHPKFGWPGGRAIAHFTGTDVTVTLDDTSLFAGPGRWDVIVDGDYSSTLVPSAGTATYAIASGLAPAEHTVEIYKRNEGKVGITQFLGFAFPNGGQLLSPPPTPTRRIEFLGDSTTNGYGDECAAANENFSGATQNERLAYSGLIAHDLGADHHDVSYSGKGVLLNYLRSDTVVFDQLYPRTMPGTAAADWVFSTFTPDVVWITLGGNDWDWDSSTPQTAPPDETLFTNKYIALVTTVRSKYPAAHIFCAIAPSLNDNYPLDAMNQPWKALTHMRNSMTAVVANRSGAGDAKVYKYEFTRAIYPTDLTGCGFHANLGLHRKMADEAIVAIKAKTGWP